jgi:hypothetical protein
VAYFIIGFPLPKVSTSDANRLVGNYGATEQWVCVNQIHNNRLNYVFEVSDIKYPPRSELEAHRSKKWKDVPASEVETTPKKVKVVKKRRLAARAEEKTSAMEKVLAKPLKASKNLSLKETHDHSSGLSITKKALAAKSNIKGVPMTFVKGDKICHIFTPVISLLVSSYESRGPSPPASSELLWHRLHL